MFGIKTKKDKKIESLEEKIKTLEARLYESRFKQPRIYQQNAKIETVTAMQMIEPGMPIDLVKSKIVAMMIGQLKDKYVHYDIEQDARTQNIVLRGYLNYVIDWGNEVTIMDAVEREKIDKAIEEMKMEIYCDNGFSQGVQRAMDILKRNIGENK